MGGTLVESVQTLRERYERDGYPLVDGGVVRGFIKACGPRGVVIGTDYHNIYRDGKHHSHGYCGEGWEAYFASVVS